MVTKTLFNEWLKAVYLSWDILDFSLSLFMPMEVSEYRVEATNRLEPSLARPAHWRNLVASRSYLSACPPVLQRTSAGVSAFQLSESEQAPDAMDRSWCFRTCWE